MEWGRTDCGRYRIESLTASTIPGALEVIKESFLKDGIIPKAVGLDSNPAAIEEMLKLCADAALDGVSVVAVEIDTGHVAAASFNKLLVSTKDSSGKSYFDVFCEEHCTQPSSIAQLKFMSDVNRRVNLFEKFKSDCSLELMFLATLHKHKHQKLALYLIKSSIELGKKLKDGPVALISLKDLGPKYAHLKPRPIINMVPTICQARASSISTQKIGRALGIDVHNSVPISEFIYNGKNFADIIGFDFVCELFAGAI